ncbi:MAG: helix-turn-helix domain-containing protein [Clostridia bacterium]|nr:helix-turn-helix domain-containing protein [Clostridia bacterium]
MLKKTKKNLLLGFMLQYLMIVLVVLSVQYISNAFLINSIESNVEDILSSTVENDVKVIESNIEQIKETTINIGTNLFSSLSQVDSKAVSFVSDITEVQNNLSKWCNPNDKLIMDICIQNDDKDLLVGATTAYRKRINFYKTKLRSNKESAEELLELSEKARAFSFGNASYYYNNFEALMFTVPAPLLRKRTGSVISFIDKKNLMLPIQNVIADSNGALFAVDENGTCFLDFGKNLEIDYKKYITNKEKKLTIGNKVNYLFKIKGNTTGWTYMFFLPEKYVLNRARVSQIVIMIFNVLALLLGLILCYLVARKKGNSYIDLLNGLGVNEERVKFSHFIRNDEYKGLGIQLSKIKNENSFLLKAGAQNILKSILGGHIEKEKIKAELFNYKILLEKSPYIVLAVRFINENNLVEHIEKLTDYIARIVSEVIPEAKICLMDKESVAIVCSRAENKQEETIEKLITRIKYEVFLRYNIKATIGAGEYIEDVNELPLSYRQACEVAEYNFLTETDASMFYNKLPVGENEYYYPIEMENNLLESVKNGEFEKAREILIEIREENFVNRKLCVSAINELFAELRASAKKISALQFEEGELFQKRCSINHFFEDITNVVYYICSNIERENEIKSKGEKRIEKVEEYIKSNYHNSALSVEMIANTFNIHPSYLSSLYKKQRGITLIGYIEKIRIEKAIELLTKENYNINEISSKVGFSNSTSFRRSFKKIKGTSPTKYM